MTRPRFVSRQESAPELTPVSRVRVRVRRPRQQIVVRAASLPDEPQDRPEQNEGYDDAVRGGPAGTPQDPLMDVDTELTTEDPDAELPGAGPGGTSREADLAEIDDRAARAAAAEVRRRERGPR